MYVYTCVCTYFYRHAYIHLSCPDVSTLLPENRLLYTKWTGPVSSTAWCCMRGTVPLSEFFRP